METDVYASGWHALVDPEVNVGGSWTDVQEIYGNHGGVWSTTWKRNFVFTKTFSVDTLDYGSSINSEMVSNGWNGADPVVLAIVINAGVALGSSTPAASLVLSGFPGGSSVTLYNNSGYILGKGGNGGLSGGGFPGQTGGDALQLGYATTVYNNGMIAGGGGGGGEAFPGGGGSGGGAGYDVGLQSSGWFDGDPGTRFTGGVGGGGYPGTPGDPEDPPIGGPGGNGGNIGLPGQDRATVGGPAGKYLVGDAYVSWAVVGDLRGNHS